LPYFTVTKADNNLFV